ncbi:MFS transporter [Nocardioides sp. URHA0020]|uniref:MFS transporter n=1 Tax=Nocardioides sp. URHA0020 TaxID=1380392 RepID=UPI000687D476|nr:MFS transporter [Nocardioides sp. URHA0020]
MLGVTHAGSIRLVLSGPAVPRTFALALVGRLAYGLLPLCLLFTIRDASGSFAVAASAAAALALASLSMPLQSRLVDRHGQRRVLPVYAAAYVATLVAVALLATGSHPDWLWLLLGVALGVSGPALGPAMRAQWREIAEEGPARRVAYSLDSIAEESLHLVGPVAASVVLATGPARTGLLVAAVLITLGTTALVTSPYVPAAGGHTRPAGLAPGGGPAGVLRRATFRRLLVVMLMFGTASAACFTGVAALADRAGRPSVLGLIEAAAAVGAIAAGVAWTRLRGEPSWVPTLGALLLVTATAHVGVLLAAPHLVLVGACLVLSGAAAAPIYVVSYTAADELVPPEQRTEASTWVTTAINAGSAAGTAGAGLLLTAGGDAPFVLAAAVSATAATALLVARRRC